MRLEVVNFFSFRSLEHLSMIFSRIVLAVKATSVDKLLATALKFNYFFFLFRFQRSNSLKSDFKFCAILSAINQKVKCLVGAAASSTRN